MYEELVKRLRRCEQFKCRECEYEQIMGCRAKLNSEAADAIEELEACADFYEHTSAMGLKLARSVLEAWPKWIPVSDRLPEEYTRVIGFMAWKAMAAIEYQNGKWYSIDHLAPLPDEAVTH